MRDKLDPKDMAEALHLRGNVCIRTTAMGDDHAGVINNTGRAGPTQKLEGFCEEDLGLKAGKCGIVLDEESPGITQNQSCTLSLNLLFAKDNLVR